MILLLYFIADLSSFSIASDSVGFNFNDRQFCRSYRYGETPPEPTKKEMGTYFEGKIAGEQYAERGGELQKGACAGACCGIGGLAYPLLSSPDLPTEAKLMLEGKSEEYKMGFYEGYRARKQGNAWKGALAGWVIAIVVVLVVLQY